MNIYSNETADLFFQRIHVFHALRDRDCPEHLIVAYSRTPGGYNKVCEWIVPGTLDLRA